MKNWIYIFFLVATFSCQNTRKKENNTIPKTKINPLILDSELNEICQKHPFLTDFVNNLINDSLVYKKCKKCNLRGLNAGNLIGYTDRVRPTGNYFRKNLKIGAFKFDAFFVYEKKHYKKDSTYNRIYKRVYFCYFDEKQQKKFSQFSHYYDNMISHGKQLLDIKYINNTAILTIQYAGY